jgi:putative DNA primase/helicase
MTQRGFYGKSYDDDGNVVYDPDDPPADELHRSHLRMAERLAARHSARLRHAHGVGWLVWDGTRWARDRDGEPMRAAIEIVKEAHREASSDDDTDLGKDVRKAETASALAGILKIAACIRPLAVAAADLDTDPYLFNCANATLDLRTGQLRPHNPDDLITKVAGCGYDPQADGPVFAKFLAEILPDDVREFVQRLFGYSMLGLVLEHILAIFTGVGQNGKTTLIEVVKAAFGDYAITAEPELLVEKNYAHPTGQADLLGVRLAVTTETEGRLAGATVKRLTGGDKIRARRMRQDFIEFDPSHTVIMVTNHKPQVSGDDPALWRRLRVVPFDVVIPDPDSGLPGHLRLELPAVLAWACAGYQAYTEHLLDAPEAVTKRTEAYRAASDALGRFLADRTTEQQFAAVRARELYAAWCAWCAAAGEEQGSEVQFAESMSNRGFTKKRSGVGQVYRGLGLVDESLADSEEATS